MRSRAAPADLQRWSEEVARDPGAPSFVPLADAYRRQGNRDAALRLCLRGLERDPANVQAHTLLARLYLEVGEREKAFDEWGTALRLDSANFEANRGMGFVHLERGDLGSAQRALERAASERPGDVAVKEALAVLRDRLGDIEAQAQAQAPDPAQSARVPSPAQPQAAPRDPARLFESMEGESPFLGALVMDGRGLVHAGSLSGRATGGAEMLGAMLGGAVEEAARTAGLLGLGSWRGMLMEAESAQLHVAPIADDLLVLMAARSDAPAGWVMRAAQRAADIGRSFVEQGR